MTHTDSWVKINKQICQCSLFLFI